MTTNPAISSERTLEERRSVLAGEVADRVRHGYRVESQTDLQAVVVKGRRPSHLLHLILSFVTLGVWAVLVWLPLSVFGGEKRRVITVDSYGNVAERKGRG